MTAKVLVVDHAHSPVCGIHDLGQRIAACLRHSTELEVVHLDIGDANGWHNALDIVDPDMVILNYRPDLMPWWPATLARPSGVARFAVLHQYEEATAHARAGAIRADGFDGVLALDPLLDTGGLPWFHAVGRPIPETVEHDPLRLQCPGHPVVGSFGFAFPHKGFQSVATEIADQCPAGAMYRLHMPEAYFNGTQGQPLYTDSILSGIQATFTDPERWLELCYTSAHLAERELVHRLSMNDVNCLLYAPGQPDAGLSSALDYLIAARRPMLLSAADMFRHGRYLDPALPDHLSGFADWPTFRLGDVLSAYDYWQEQADRLYAWHHGRLVADIERIIAGL